jgi:hypothetical protein
MPRGGKRPGAGRPKGSAARVISNEAIKAARTIDPRGYRVPDDAPPAMRELADRALQRISDVMEEGIGAPIAPSVIKAAQQIREEVCGPVEKRVRISGSLEAMLMAIEPESEEPAA